MSNVRFVTDRQRIFAHIAEETGDDKLLEIVTGQYAIYDVIEGFLAEGVEFSASGLAASWRPNPANFPNVVLNPKWAHGQPVIGPVGAPTAALFDLWRAEGLDYALVADWFEIEEAYVREAVAYEIKLAA